ncbi:MAG: hypothetical protein HOP29_03250 [Phycisphaerales bacterium]|nr:hypothetical protein [Phycisphaerales bacterium]
MNTFVAPLLDRRGNPIETPTGEAIHWLDRMLDGGLREAPEPGRPLVVLFSGPPGAGKSLLVQQICYETAYSCCRNFQPTDNAVLSAAEHASSLLITSETSPFSLVKNMASLGSAQCPSSAAFHLAAPNAAEAGLYVFDTMPKSLSEMPDAANLIAQGSRLTPLMIVGAGPTTIDALGDVKKITNAIKKVWKDARSRWQTLAKFPKALVIDSLNVLTENGAGRSELFRSLLSLFSGTGGTRGPDFLFLVLDTPGTNVSVTESGHEFWEYVADASIRVDYSFVGEEKHFVRHLEVVKTRFQYHILGRHLLKVFSNRSYSPQESPPNLAVDPESARPHLFRGGPFVFPSLHYILSKTRTGKKLIKTQPGSTAAVAEVVPSAGSYKNPDDPDTWASWGPRALAQPGTVNWPVAGCSELVGGGIPMKRTVALVGPRGGRTSYFAYQFLLDGIELGERVLLLSFMEPRDAALLTLAELAKAPQYANIRKSPKIIEDRLFIVYQRAGYVAPEEWLHRVIEAVGSNGPTRIALVAIDQWESAFPLLDASRILIPTLIEFLGVHDVTSMIASVGLDDARLGRSGLTAKSAVTLTFQHRSMPWQDPPTWRASLGLGTDWFAKDVPLVKPHPTNVDRRTKLIVRATRVGRGSPGFSRAVLEFMPGGPADGSKMMPLAPEFEEGLAILA